MLTEYETWLYGEYHRCKRLQLLEFLDKWMNRNLEDKKPDDKTHNFKIKEEQDDNEWNPQCLQSYYAEDHRFDYKGSKKLLQQES